MLTEYFTVVAGSIPVLLLGIKLASLGKDRKRPGSDGWYGKYAVYASGIAFPLALIGLMGFAYDWIQWVLAGLTGLATGVLAIVLSAQVIHEAEGDGEVVAVESGACHVVRSQPAKE